MEVTMDKLGRIEIPKKIRELLGLRPGQTLEMTANREAGRIDLTPKDQPLAVLRLTDQGIPVFYFDPPVELDFDVIELIRKDREERDAKIAGL